MLTLPDPRHDDAVSLRRQAAEYRRLSRNARTKAGIIALNAVAEQFDRVARHIDPHSERLP